MNWNSTHFQEGNDDLGLDQYEGRSWRGSHHHSVMSAIACLLVVVEYLSAKETSGLTWKQALRAMQPLLVRPSGVSPYCLTESEDLLPVYA
jgi:hypothetical protein